MRKIEIPQTLFAWYVDKGVRVHQLVEVKWVEKDAPMGDDDVKYPW